MSDTAHESPSASRRTTIIAIATALAIAAHLVLRFGMDASPPTANIPLFAAYVFGGVPLVGVLLFKLFRRQFGSDLLAGMSIVTALILGEYLAGVIVILMLSGGEALESFALARASSALRALAKRMPSIAHRKQDGGITDVALDDMKVGDELVVYPHETCPVDGVVLDGQSVMDESYLTGEPFMMRKTAGSAVISGAINGDGALTIRATKRAVDSRYARIMAVMRESEATRPRMRRLGDQLGAWYTPLALLLAAAAWLVSGDPVRFLAVLVVATPCPLLIAIPVAIIGSISQCAKRAIIIKQPAALETTTQCRTAIFDKTGTLTYGKPTLTQQLPAQGMDADELLRLVASLERYAKHPLASAIRDAAEKASLSLLLAEHATEPPGEGLRGEVAGRKVQVLGRKHALALSPQGIDQLPPHAGGLECIVLLDGRYAATYRFRDAPRSDSKRLVTHLGPKHHFRHVMILSGDRASEVQYLAEQVGIDEVHAEMSPEQKLARVRQETAKAKTLYVGDGINDAPAMMAATVGVAIGQGSDVTSEAADVVLMDNTISKVDEFLHICQRMRHIALQSAVGGMALSVVGMLLAAAGWLDPVSGAVAQEVIDVLAVLNALRAALPPRQRMDL
jgi:heavy metal translocating P-type ATPase